jgi:hypothetical protein
MMNAATGRLLPISRRGPRLHVIACGAAEKAAGFLFVAAAPLFEKEGYTDFETLFSYFHHPGWFHRPGARPDSLPTILAAACHGIPCGFPPYSLPGYLRPGRTGFTLRHVHHEVVRQPHRQVSHPQGMKTGVSSVVTILDVNASG